MYSENFILGSLLSRIGLTLNEAQKIAEGNLNLNKSPEDIRDFLLEDSEEKVTFLRSLFNTGLNLDEFSTKIGIPSFSINDIDNVYFWFNKLNFSLKVNIEFRKKIVHFLLNKNFTVNSISKILNVSPSVINKDRITIPWSSRENFY